MRRRTPVVGIGAALLFTLGVGCGQRPKVPRCRRDADCAKGQVCAPGGVCALSGAADAGGNRAPTAAIAGNATVAAATSAPLTFDGSGSSDPDPGDSIAGYAWSAARKNASCDPQPATAAGATFAVTFPCAGDFEVALVVTDTHGARSTPASVAVTVTDAPVAVVGADRQVDFGATVALDGTQSHGGTAPLTFAWTVDPLSTQLTGGDTATPTFVAGTAHQTYSATLVVTDANGLASAPATERLSVSDRPPSGAIGCSPATVKPGDTVACAVAPADPDGDLVTVSWSATDTLGNARSGSGTTFSFTFAAGQNSTATIGATLDDGFGPPVPLTPVSIATNNQPPTVRITNLPGSIGHQCTGGGCGLWDGSQSTFTVTASASDPDGTVASYHWTVQPPALSPAPAITFAPADTNSATLQVQIATQDTAIAGDYVFTVVATDNVGATTPATGTLTVTNRSPVITGAVALDVGHTFSGGAFHATGTASGAVGDPDGDPVTLVLSTPKSGAAHATFSTTPLNALPSTFNVDVPQAYPAELIGAGVSYAVDAVATDVNGAAASAAWPVTVTNRAPVATPPPSHQVSSGHVYDTVNKIYVAPPTGDQALSSFQDPDGDPVTLSSFTGDSQCATFTFTGGTFRVRCTLAYDYTTQTPPPLAQLAAAHALTETVADPWTTSSSTDTYAVTSTPPTFDAVNVDAGGPYPQSCSDVRTCLCTSQSCSCGTGCTGLKNVVSSCPLLTSCLPLEAGPYDADTDPVQVTWLNGTTVVQTLVCASGDLTTCGYSPGGNATLSVQLTDEATSQTGPTGTSAYTISNDTSCASPCQ